MTVFLTPDGRAVLRRHLLPARPAARHAVVPAGARRRRRGLARRSATRSRPPADGSPAALAGRLAQRRAAARTTPSARPRPSRRWPRTRTPSTAVRRRAEVPAVDGPRVPAPARRPRRRGRRRRALRRRLGRSRSAWRAPCAAMARSGMYDQLAGGFARYSVDAGWVVPHFEKMLYDNAQLPRVYLHWWRLTGEPAGARIALETCDWMLRALGTAAGRLRLRRWTPTRPSATPTGRARRRGLHLRLDAGPAGRRPRPAGRGVGRRAAPGDRRRAPSSTALDPAAGPRRVAPTRRGQRWEQVRAAAAGRPRAAPPAGPRRQGGRRLERPGDRGARRDGRPARTGPTWSAAADRAADLLLPSTSSTAAGSRRVSRDGVAGAPAGVLEDYADVAEGLLALYAVTGDPAWLQVAGELLDIVLEHFADGGRHVFYDTPDDAPTPRSPRSGAPRTRPTTPTPSGWSAACGALLSLRRADRLAAAPRRRPRQALAVAARRPAPGRRAPFGWALAVGRGSRRRAARGGRRRRGPDARPAPRCTRSRSPAPRPELVLGVGEPDAAGVPLLADRPLVDGAAAAYVCRGVRLPGAGHRSRGAGRRRSEPGALTPSACSERRPGSLWCYRCKRVIMLT